MVLNKTRFWQTLHRVAPIAFGVGLFGLGLWALHHLLSPVDPGDVRAQMRATPVPDLLTALGATVLGYVALMGYDWWALRFLGKTLPLRVVTIGSFLGCAFGNTIGISAVSGGAVRYRIYAAYGLNGFEVASLSSYIAVAMGIGLTWIGITALAFYPTALVNLLPLAPETVRLLAAGASFIMIGSLLALSARSHVFRLGRFEVPLPCIPDMLGQIATSVLDVIMAALTLYVLMPAGAPDFPAFVAIYSIATMIGVLSHVPGGIGVFETVIIAAMPAGTAVGDVAAGLLLFRIIYYLVPFSVAFLMVSFNEARNAGGFIARRMGGTPAILLPAFSGISGIVPALVAFVAFGLGVYLLLVAMLPSVRANAVEEVDLIAAILLEGGTLVSAVVGVVLLILSHALVRRVSAAYWLTLVMLAGGAIGSLLNDFDYQSALLLIGGGVALLPFSEAFYRKTKLTVGVFSPAWFMLVSAILAATVAFFMFAHETTLFSQDLWTQFSAHADAPRSLRAGLAASAVFLVFSIFLALQPARRKAPADKGTALERAAAIVARQDQPQACLALSGDKLLHFGEDDQGFVMYGRRGKLWIAFGDPVAPPTMTGAIAWDFFETAQAASCKPVFYEVSDAHLPIWIEMGMALHKIGEEAVIKLPGFSLGGSRFKSMRAAFNKRKRGGDRFEVLLPPHSDSLLSELNDISDLWLNSKTGREKQFSVGRFDPEYLNRFPIAVIRREDSILAFANILAPGTGRKVAIDLMRYRPEDASGMMEFLFLSLIEHYQAAGAEELSLGVAPLAGLSPHRSARMWNRIGVMMFRHGGAFYNFEGLRAYKQKFQPEWRARYLALPLGVSPMVAMADVALLISGGARGLLRK